MFPYDERAAVLEQCRQRSKKDGLALDSAVELWNYFVDKTREVWEGGGRRRGMGCFVVSPSYSLPDPLPSCPQLILPASPPPPSLSFPLSHCA